MSPTVTIGLVGDYEASIPAHQAIPRALALAEKALAVRVQAQWLPTEEIHDDVRLTALSGVWCVPGSPYRNMEGALRAIRFAREQHCPFLGTCGGFQHAVIEYARNVLGWHDADHAEICARSDTGCDHPTRLLSGRGDG